MRTLSRPRTNLLAFTLVELLVALTIALVLTVVALPRVREGLQQNVAARTATLVRSTFENARSQAIRTGRPYGVRLHRVANIVSTANGDFNNPVSEPSQGANYCKQLSFVQMAFEYAGDDVDANIQYEPVGTQRNRFVVESATSGLLFAVADGRVPLRQRPFGVGSTIRIGTDATPYIIDNLVAQAASGSIPERTVLTLRSLDPMRPGGRIPTERVPLPYAIETRPLPSPLAPVELPGKIVLDLAASGTSQNATQFAPATIEGGRGVWPIIRPAVSPAIPDYGFHDVVIMFAPTGLVDGIYVDQFFGGSYSYTRTEPSGSLSLLIGEVDGVVLPLTTGIYPFARTGTNGTDPPIDTNLYAHKGRKAPNFSNPNCTWITIHPTSGKVLLHKAAPTLDPVGAPPSLTPTDQSIEGRAHPEYAAQHSPEIIVRNRILDSRRFVRGQSL